MFATLKVTPLKVRPEDNFRPDGEVVRSSIGSDLRRGARIRRSRNRLDSRSQSGSAGIFLDIEDHVNQLAKSEEINRPNQPADEEPNRLENRHRSSGVQIHDKSGKEAE